MRLTADMTFRRLWHRTALLVGTSLLSVVIHLAAWLALLVTAAPLVGSPAPLPPLLAERLNPIDLDAVQAPALVLIGGLFALAASARLLVGWAAADLRSRAFGLAMDDIATAIERGGGSVLGPMPLKALSKLLQRDARYIAKAVGTFADLPVALVTVIGLLCAGIVFAPLPLGIAAGAVAASLPFHLLVAAWGQRVTESLLATAIEKRHTDEEAINDRLANPFRPPDASQMSGTEPTVHAALPSVRAYLSAYRKRMLLGVASSAVSTLTLALIVTGALAYLRFAADSASPLLAIGVLILALRYLYGSISQTAQAVTVVYSYGPLVHDALVLFGGLGYHRPTSARPVPLGRRVLLFTRTPASHLLAKDLSPHLGGEVPSLVHGQWRTPPEGGLPPELMARSARILGTSGARAPQASGPLANPSIATNEDRRLVLTALHFLRAGSSSFLVSGASLSTLTPEARAALLDEFGKSASLVIAYAAVPKRLTLSEPFDVAVLDDHGICVLGRGVSPEPWTAEIQRALMAPPSYAGTKVAPGFDDEL